MSDSATAKGTRKRWQGLGYDDENLLIRLRLNYPKLSWTQITELFNQHVPVERQRTADAITNKGPQLMKAYNNGQVALQSLPGPSVYAQSGTDQVRFPNM